MSLLSGCYDCVVRGAPAPPPTSHHTPHELISPTTHHQPPTTPTHTTHRPPPTTQHPPPTTHHPPPTTHHPLHHYPTPPLTTHHPSPITHHSSPTAHHPPRVYVFLCVCVCVCSSTTTTSATSHLPSPTTHHPPPTTHRPTPPITTHHTHTYTRKARTARDSCSFELNEDFSRRFNIIINAMLGDVVPDRCPSIHSRRQTVQFICLLCSIWAFNTSAVKSFFGALIVPPRKP